MLTHRRGAAGHACRLREEAAAGGAAACRRRRRQRAGARRAACAAASRWPSRSPCRPSRRTTPSASRSLDDLNRDSPLKPVFFELDSAELERRGQQTLQENAERAEEVRARGRSPSRDTATSAARRSTTSRSASAARWPPATISSRSASRPTRVRTVSYGKEFPFDPGARRGGLVEEPPRALRDHREVSGNMVAHDDGIWSIEPRWRSRPSPAVAAPARGAEQARDADDGRHPHAAGADPAAAAAARRRARAAQRDPEELSTRASTSRPAATRKAFADQKLRSISSAAICGSCGRASTKPTCASRRCRRRSRRCGWRFRSIRRRRRRSPLDPARPRASRADRRVRRTRRRRATAAGAPPPARHRASRRSGCSTPRGPTTPPASGRCASGVRHVPAHLPAQRRSPTTRSSTSASASSPTASTRRRWRPTTSVIANYPRADKAPDAYYKRGMAFERLGQMDRARESYETLHQDLPGHRRRPAGQAEARSPRARPATASDCALRSVRRA